MKTTRPSTVVSYPAVFTSLFICLIPGLALAAPFGGPLVGFAQSLLDFLTSTLGPIVFGLGLAISAYGFFVGQREALQRGVYVIVGGVILFSIPSVISFVEQASR